MGCQCFKVKRSMCTCRMRPYHKVWNPVMDWARELNQIIVFQIIPHGLANGFFCHFCNQSTCINIFSFNKAYI